MKLKVATLLLSALPLVPVRAGERRACREAYAGRYRVDRQMHGQLRFDNSNKKTASQNDMEHMFPAMHRLCNKKSAGLMSAYGT